MTEEKVESAVLPIRIPSEVRSTIDDIVLTQKNPLRKVAADMLSEYAPIKSRLVKPFLIHREFYISDTKFCFEPDTVNSGMILKIEQSFSKPIFIKIAKDEQESIYDLVANLLLFANSI